MQLLIVHHDVEVGEQLVAMVTEYTEHHCGFATSGARALQWARSAARCSLLITQLDGEGVNGLSLGGSLSEMFAGLQTMFLPEYSAAEQRVEVPHPKVFPEPIDGERLLAAIERADAQRQTGLDLYHAVDVLQMCCLSGRSGALQFVRGSAAALAYLQNGRIAHAECGASVGTEALEEIASWQAVEFAYDYSLRAPTETIEAHWDTALVAAVAKQRGAAS
jgi:DNA-binding NtrC family response regulator